MILQRSATRLHHFRKHTEKGHGEVLARTCRPGMSAHWSLWDEKRTTYAQCELFLILTDAGHSAADVVQCARVVRRHR